MPNDDDVTVGDLSLDALWHSRDDASWCENGVPTACPLAASASARRRGERLAGDGRGVAPRGPRYKSQF